MKQVIVYTTNCCPCNAFAGAPPRRLKRSPYALECLVANSMLNFEVL